LLKHCTDSITSAQDYVTIQALVVVFSKDADFQSWFHEARPNGVAQLLALLADRPSTPANRRVAASPTRQAGE
jgi:hypothetical protein